MTSKDNPYTHGSNDWISFEWDALCSELRSAIANIKPWNEIANTGALPFDDVDEVKVRMEEFRQQWFPTHRGT